jgi:prepilin-type N-terminal cleavage/methylation domain-containing protein
MDHKRDGFTLLEVLLVVAIIAILAGIVILAINPSKQLGDTRNTQRKADVNTILNAVYQYTIDNNGDIPTTIPLSSDCNIPATNEICKTNGICSNLIDLSVVSNAKKYLVEIPIDPKGSSSTYGTGYFIAKDATNRVTVCAPRAEQGKVINATR